MNTLYLWSGHPFASLVRLKDYPYAVEVPDDVFRKNQEMFRWLAQECDKRGIWLVQMFYNILVSKPFAETNGISTPAFRADAAHGRLHAQIHRGICEGISERRPDGLPGRGVAGHAESTGMVHECDFAGRARRHEGGRIEGGAAGRHPHSRDGRLCHHSRRAQGVYEHLDRIEIQRRIADDVGTARQGSGHPSGHEQTRRRTWSTSTSCPTSNRSATATSSSSRNACRRARDRLGATGIHLYPLSYWNWPYSPDIADPPLLQWKRDWIWFEAWARYSWNPDIPAKRRPCLLDFAAGGTLWQHQRGGKNPRCLQCMPARSRRA